MARHQPHVLVDLAKDRVRLDEQTFHHLTKVLRYPAGGAVSYTDGVGTVGSGTFTDGTVVRGEERYVPRPRQLTVAVAPPHASARVRFVVEKLAELGVARLLWLETTRGEGRPPKPAKAEAWMRGAVEQSRGAWLMEIGETIQLEEVARWGTPVFAEQGGESITELTGVDDPVLCVGPEGGFAPGELPDGVILLHLGQNVLRVETAAIAGAALFINEGRAKTF